MIGKINNPRKSAGADSDKCSATAGHFLPVMMTEIDQPIISGDWLFASEMTHWSPASWSHRQLFTSLRGYLNELTYWSSNQLLSFHPTLSCTRRLSFPVTVLRSLPPI